MTMISMSSIAAVDVATIEKLSTENFEKAFVKKDFSAKDVAPLRITLGSVIAEIKADNYSTMAGPTQRLLTTATLIRLQYPQAASKLPIENYWATFSKFYRNTTVTATEMTTLNKVAATMNQDYFFELLEKYNAQVDKLKTNSGFLDLHVFLCRHYLSLGLQPKFEACIIKARSLQDEQYRFPEEITQLKVNFYLTHDLTGLAEKAMTELTQRKPEDSNYYTNQFLLARLVSAKGDVPQGVKILNEVEAASTNERNFRYPAMMWRTNLALFEKKIPEAEKDLAAVQKLFNMNDDKSNQVQSVKITRAVYHYLKKDYPAAAKDINQAVDYFSKDIYTTIIYSQLLKAMFNRRANPQYVPKSELEFFTSADKKNKQLNPVEHLKIETQIGLVLSQSTLTPADVTRLENLVKDLKKKISFCQPLLTVLDDFVASQKKP